MINMQMTNKQINLKINKSGNYQIKEFIHSDIHLPARQCQALAGGEFAYLHICLLRKG